MRLYKSNEPNTFHYVTMVAHNRVPVFRKDKACEIFVDILREVRERFPYKLIGYVWSSCRAYLPHGAGQVPIEIDWQAYWKDDEPELQKLGRKAGSSPPLNAARETGGWRKGRQ